MLPEAFLDRMKEMLQEEYEAFAASFEQEKYQALRLNALKRNRQGENAAEMYRKHEDAFERFHLSKVDWAEDGYYYDKDSLPGKHPYHEAGVYYIQEPSAMAPVAMLGVRPGERILDMCAAPGGKSTQIAAALQGRGLLVSNEIHPARAKILSENVERMGIRNACVTNETPARLAGYFPDYFDRILVDAPCSGEGMFRKNDAACAEWSPDAVLQCAKRQAEILESAAGMLSQGGTLVYSTCTFSVQENEESINSFVERHPEFKIRDMRRLWPHRVRGEGHFAALLVKEGEGGGRCLPKNGLERGILAGELKKQWLPYFSFAKESLRVHLEGEYIQFGDNLYLIPEEFPSVKGLKVLRTGLHLGTLKKERFEPAHALALSLAPTEAVHTWELKADEPAVRAYLNGQTFPADGEKGWYLICVDGFSLGWGKLAGGVMKNHYPKGLRLPC